MAFTKTQVDLMIEGAYAEIYCDANATTQSIPNSPTVYTKVTNFNANGESANCTADVANDKITITQLGSYKLEASVSFEGDTSNQNWFGAIFVDGVELPEIHFERRVGTNIDHGATAIGGIYDITSVPVDVDLRFRHSNATAENLTLTYANLNAVRIGV